LNGSNSGKRYQETNQNTGTREAGKCGHRNVTTRLGVPLETLYQLQSQGADMRIGELAKAAGVQVETIRYYEREGLLGAASRQSNGYRSYGADHQRRLTFIRHCRSLDVGLPDVRELLSLLDNPERGCTAADSLVETQIERVRRRIAALRSLETELVGLRARCTSPSVGATCRILVELAKPTEGQNTGV
jgi:DNA-binding transcriptional MerR regulator